MTFSTALARLLHDRRPGRGRASVRSQWADRSPDARDWSVGALLAPSRPSSR